MCGDVIYTFVDNEGKMICRYQAFVVVVTLDCVLQQMEVSWFTEESDVSLIIIHERKITYRGNSGMGGWLDISEAGTELPSILPM
ncbi:hypothetical protein J6590_077950 [Homalodisca vitripennis]|nr:hypothetical protein J6590_077950 [Homalodisca vitripennis]